MLWMIPLFGINVRWDVRVKLVSFKVHSCWHFEIHQIPRDEALKWFDTRFTKSENFSVRYSGTGSVVKLNSYKLTPPPTHTHATQIVWSFTTELRSKMDPNLDRWTWNPWKRNQRDLRFETWGPLSNPFFWRGTKNMLSSFFVSALAL